MATTTINGTNLNDFLVSPTGQTTINGNGGNDVIVGKNGPNTLNGSAGNDTIVGGNSGDTINGGTGSDTMVGGNGKDTFIEAISENYLYHDIIDGGNGKDILILQGTAHQLQLLSSAIAAFNASNKSQVFHFGNYAGGILNLDVINVETLQFVTVANSAPIAVNDTATISASAPGALIGNVLTNDRDPDVGDVIAVTTVVNMVGAYGSLIIQSNGSYSYTLNHTTSSALLHGQVVHDVFTYAISDGQGGTATASLNITVTGTNHAPVLSASNVVTSVNENITGIIMAKLSATDADGDPLTYSLSGPNAAKFSLDANHNLILSSPADYESQHSLSVTVKVSEGIAATDQTQTFTFAVNNLNDNAPIVSTSNVVTNVDENATGVVMAQLSATDADGDPLTYSLSGPDAAKFSIDANHKLILTSPADYESQHSLSVSVVVSDGMAAHDQTQNFTFAVNNVNDIAPIVSVVGNVITDVNENTSGIIMAQLSATDVEGDTLTYSLSGPDSAKFSLDANHNLILSSPADYETQQSLSVAVIVSDGVAAHDQTQNFTFAVNNVNEAPVATLLDLPITVPDISAQDLTAALLNNITDVDANHTLSIVSISDAPYITFVDSQVIFDPIADFVNLSQGETFTINFSYVAQDEFGAQSQTVNASLIVTGVNEAPVGTATLEMQYVFSGDSLAERFFDIDELDTLTYSFVNPISGLSIDSNTGIVSYSFDPDQHYSFISAAVLATDNHGGQSNSIPLSIIFDPVYYTGGMLFGTAGNELDATLANQILIALGADETIKVGSGNNFILGMDNDILSLENLSTDITLNLDKHEDGTQTATSSDTSINQIYGISSFIGGGGSNTLILGSALTPTTFTLDGTSGSLFSEDSLIIDTFSHFQNIVDNNATNDVFNVGMGSWNLTGNAAAVDTLAISGATAAITFTFNGMSGTAIALDDSVNVIFTNIQVIKDDSSLADQDSAIFSGATDAMSFILDGSGASTSGGGMAYALNNIHTIKDNNAFDDNFSVVSGTWNINGNALQTGYISFSPDAGNGQVNLGLGNYNIIGISSERDIVSFINATSGITIDLPTGSASGGGIIASLMDINTVIGTNYDDILTASSGAQYLFGGLGSDTLTGGTDDNTVAVYALDASNYTVVTDSFGNITQVIKLDGSGTDTLSNITKLEFGGLKGPIVQHVVTSTASTLVGGNTPNNLIVGGATNDVIIGAVQTVETTTNTSNLSYVGSQIYTGEATEVYGTAESVTTTAQVTNTTYGGNTIVHDSLTTIPTLVGTIGTETIEVGAATNIQNTTTTYESNVITSLGDPIVIGSVNNFTLTSTSTGGAFTGNTKQFGSNNTSLGVVGNTIITGNAAGTLYGTAKTINITGDATTTTSGTTISINNNIMTFGANSITTRDTDNTGATTQFFRTELSSINGINGTLVQGATLTTRAVYQYAYANPIKDTLIGDIGTLSFTLLGGSITGGALNSTVIHSIQGNTFTFGANKLTTDVNPITGLRTGAGNDLLIGNIQNLNWVVASGTVTGTTAGVTTNNLVDFRTNNFTFAANTLLTGGGDDILIGNIQTFSVDITGGYLSSSPGINISTVRVGAGTNPFTFGNNILTAGDGNNLLIGNIQNLTIDGYGGSTFANTPGAVIGSGIDPNGSSYIAFQPTFGANVLTAGNGNNTLIGSIQNFSFVVKAGPATTSGVSAPTLADTDTNISGLNVTFIGNKLTVGNGNNTLIGDIGLLNFSVTGGANSGNINTTTSIANITNENFMFGGNTLIAGTGTNTLIGSIDTFQTTVTDGSGPLPHRGVFWHNSFTFGNNILIAGGSSSLYGDIRQFNVTGNGGEFGTPINPEKNIFTFGNNNLTASSGTLVGDIDTFNVSLTGSQSTFRNNTFTFGNNTLQATGSGTVTMYGNIHSFSFSTAGVVTNNIINLGNNTLIAGSGPTTMFGSTPLNALNIAGFTVNGGINDLRAGAGSVTMNGGYGINYADFSKATGSATATLATTTPQTVALGLGPITFNAMQGLIGSNFADTLSVGTVAGTSYLFGGKGNDTLNGTTTAGATTVAVFSGQESDYTFTYNADGTIRTVNDKVLNRDGLDTLNGIPKLQFGGIYGKDTLFEGTLNNDVLSAAGLSGKTYLLGADGNDTLTGSTVAGAVTTAVFSGNRTDYSFTFNANGTLNTVIDNVVGRDGTDTLNNISTLQFQDRLYYAAPNHIMPFYSTSGVNGNATASGTGQDIIDFDGVKYIFTENWLFTYPNFVDSDLGNATFVGGHTSTLLGNRSAISFNIDLRSPHNFITFGTGADDDHPQLLSNSFYMSINSNTFIYDSSAIIGGDGNYTLTGSAGSFDLTLQPDYAYLGGVKYGTFGIAFTNNDFNFNANYLSAGSGNHTLIGGIEDWKISINNAPNSVFFATSTDYFQGNTFTFGDMVLRAGSGADTLIGDVGSFLLDVAAVGTYINHYQDNAIIFGNNTLYGGSGTTTMYGVSPDLALFDEFLTSTFLRPTPNHLTLGNNTLVSGSGNDTMWGYGRNLAFLVNGNVNQVTIGHNTFVFDASAVQMGADIIADFNMANDNLTFQNVLLTTGTDVGNINQMIYSFRNDGNGHVKAVFLNGGSITFSNIAYTGQTSIAQLVSNVSQLDATGIAAANIINLGAGNVTVTQNVSNSSITAGDGTDVITLNGSGNLMVLGNGNDTITITGNSNMVGMGNGNNTVTLSSTSTKNAITVGKGTNTFTDSNTAGGNAFTLNVASGGTNTYTLNGSKDIVTLNDVAGIASTVTLNGNTNTLTATANGNDAIIISNGRTGNTVSIGSGTNTLTDNNGAGGNTFTVTPVLGGANNYTFNGNNDKLFISDAALSSFSNAGVTTLTINGSTNLITEVVNANAALYNYITLTIGNGRTNNTVTLGNGNDTLTINGNSNTLNLGSGNNTVTINASLNKVTLGNGTNTISITSGTNNTVTLKGGANTVTDITGGGNIFALGGVTGAGSYIFTANHDIMLLTSLTTTTSWGSVLKSASTITVNGILNTVGETGDGNNTVTLNGSFNNLSEGNGNNTTTINSGKTANTIALGGGNNVIVDKNLTGGNTFTLKNISGGANNYNFTGSNDTVTLNTLAGVTTYLHMNSTNMNNTFTTTGNGNVVLNYSWDDPSINPHLIIYNGGFEIGEDHKTYTYSSHSITLGGGNDIVVSTLYNMYLSPKFGAAIEFDTFSFGANTITTNDGADIIYGTMNDLVLSAGVNVVEGYSFFLASVSGGGRGSVWTNTFSYSGNTINSGTGNDIIYGTMDGLTLASSGAQLLSGVVSHNSFTFGGNTINAGTGNDTIYGTAKYLDMSAGVDQFLGDNSITYGNNIINSGDGDDTVYGSVQDISLYSIQNGAFGYSYIFTPEGNTITFGNNTITGGNGTDTLYSNMHNLTLFKEGSVGSDLVLTTIKFGTSILNAGTGNNTLVGQLYHIDLPHDYHGSILNTETISDFLAENTITPGKVTFNLHGYNPVLGTPASGTGIDTLVFNPAINIGTNIVNHFNSTTDILQFNNVTDSPIFAGLTKADLEAMILSITQDSGTGTLVTFKPIPNEPGVNGGTIDFVDNPFNAAHTTIDQHLLDLVNQQVSHIKVLV
jgi:large repetitive protein